MDWLGDLWRSIRYFATRRQHEADLAEEMRLHIEQRAAERRQDGLSDSEAEAAARQRFGNQLQLQERGREMWGWNLVESAWRDVRYALRNLRASPAFTLTALLSLALGIGANTAIFTLINALLLRTLPVEDPRQLVHLKTGNNTEFTNPLWEEVRTHQRSFSGMLAYSPDRFNLATTPNETHYVQGMWVSGDYFRLLGVPAIEGRMITPEDDKRGGGTSGQVAVVSYSFARRTFPKETTVAGKTIRIDGNVFTIAGVAPPWFTGLDLDRTFDVAIPLGTFPVVRKGNDALDNRANWWLQMVGRLRDGVTIEQAGQEMKAISKEVFRITLPDFFPEDAQKSYLSNAFELEPAAHGFSQAGNRYREGLYTLMAIVALVLLIACANIANLLLARATARQREISVRLAIGADRVRLLRQLLTESLLLAFMGAATGFGLALIGSRLLATSLSTANQPLEISVRPDMNVLLFSLAVTIATALLFGFVPAWRATRATVHTGLKESAASMVGRRSRFSFAKVLVAGQIALSLLLLVGAGLFVGSLRHLLNIDLGFDRHNIVMARADYTNVAVTKTQRTQAWEETLGRLRNVPGVEAAASAAIIPISGRGWAMPVKPEGYRARSKQDTLVFFNRVSPDYFKTMRTQIVAGRDFSTRDAANAPPVIIIDEACAQRFFAGTNPVGKRIGLADMDMTKPGGSGMAEVIGVVRNAKYAQVSEKPRLGAYLVSLQESEAGPEIFYQIRSSRSPEQLVPELRRAISFPGQEPMLEFRLFDQQVYDSLMLPRVIAWLSGLFGAVALFLAVIGLYGITAYATARRRSEIGIRLALGAQRQAVLWLMLRDVMWVVGCGVIVGLGLALGTSRLVKALLFGVQTNDPFQLAFMAALLIATTLVAGYLPARTASRLDPATTLRQE